MTTCPYCRRENTETVSTDEAGATPDDGDVSICYKCRNIGIFEAAAEGGVRKTSPVEDAEIRTHENVKDALMVLEKTMGPTQAAAILQAANTWQTEHLQ